MDVECSQGATAQEPATSGVTVRLCMHSQLPVGVIRGFGSTPERDGLAGAAVAHLGPSVGG